MSALTELGENVLATARRLVEGQELAPMWFIRIDQRVEIVETRWRNDAEKMAMTMMIRERLRAPDALAYVQVSEAWAGRSLAGGPPSEDPAARRDIVLVVGQARGGENFAWTLEVTTDAAGRRHLGEREVTSLDAGRMANLFDPRQVN